MVGLEKMAAEVTRISPAGDGQMYYFGYYDIPAFDKYDKRHLCNRVGFMDRLPNENDINELGYFDLETKQFKTFATTNAWNFQQGSMLQWLPNTEDDVIYNVWDDNSYKSIRQNVVTGEKREYYCPAANVSPNGKYAVSINFNRVYDFRPGYGYCNRKDPWYNIPAPNDDGVTLLNLENGEKTQIISYDKLAQLYNCSNDTKGRKIVINHITFNTASNRFLFLVRYFPESGEHWKTGLGTSDLDGNIYVLREYTYASHYFWKDEKTILIYADCGEGDGLYELTDLTQEYKLYDKTFFNEDIHCSYSPDLKWIIGDGYADEEDYRSTFLYNIEKQKGMLLGRFLAPPSPDFDIRSDLHSRWSHCGKKISFDSIHEGFRGLYIMDISDAMASLG